MHTDHRREMTFRPATTGDIGALRQFEQGIVSAERPYDPTLRPEGVQYYDIEAMLRADNVHFIVAECSGRLVGCGFARIENAKPYLSHARQAYLGLMYVDPEFRGQSINGAIVERLKQWCRDQGVTELRLDVYSGNSVALGAYEKAGFRRHMIEMRLQLMPGG